MASLGARLREERERLGFNQGELASALGQSRETQGRYESQKRAPDWDYLAAFAELGGDVLYIITGRRSSSIPLPAASDLPPRLRERLANAIAAVEAGLDAVGRSARPDLKAELVLAAYDLLSQDGERATAEIIRLVRA